MARRGPLKQKSWGFAGGSLKAGYEIEMAAYTLDDLVRKHWDKSKSSPERKALKGIWIYLSRIHRLAKIMQGYRKKFKGNFPGFSDGVPYRTVKGY